MPPLATSGFSGMHPRVQRPPENASVAVIPFAPDAGERVRELERSLGEASAELRELRAERDELKRRLGAALDELAFFRTTVRPPKPADAEASGSREIDLREATPPANAEVVTPPAVVHGSASLAGGEVARPVIGNAPAAVPSIRATPSPRSELSRLVVSTRPAPSEPAEAPRSSGANRRTSERRECEFDVEFLGDSHFITGITQDISEGGVFVATYQKLPIGTPVCIAFELPDGHRVEARGEVRWQRPEREEAGTRPGLGIAFSDLTQESLAKISGFCGSLPARYYEF
ncbi:MAG TPA: TIGR02266 family protein [Polyangiaceae bacterium]|nr:TIGR02266 family protein [Polyangiaceae bacterium]